MQRIFLFLSGAALAAFSAPAFGHHSLAMYDTSTQVSMEGVVEEFKPAFPK